MRIEFRVISEKVYKAPITIFGILTKFYHFPHSKGGRYAVTFTLKLGKKRLILELSSKPRIDILYHKE